MGRRLPSGEEVLIIRPTGKQGQALLCSSRSTPSRGPAGKPGIPKQDRNAKRSRRNAVAAKVGRKSVSGKSCFPKILFPEEPRSHTDEKDPAYGCAWGRRGGDGSECCAASSRTIVRAASAAGTTGNAADREHEPANREYESADRSGESADRKRELHDV